MSTTTSVDETSLSPGQLAELMYRAGVAPWDIGECQPVIRQAVALGAIRGEVLDPGCGTGWHALEYARAGCSVTGVDVAPTAIEFARRNARAVGLDVRFEVGDATDLEQFEGRFDTVVDSKLYDNLESTEERLRYVTALHRATKPGARLLMFGFGPGEVNGVHNHLLDEPDVEVVLPTAGFDITYVGETTYQLAVTNYKPICDACPPGLPDGRLHIPMTEAHATRRADPRKGIRSR